MAGPSFSCFAIGMLDTAGYPMIDSERSVMPNESPSPYLPPQSGASPPGPSTPASGQAPSVIKVFGILHLVFAGIGVVGVIMTVVGMIFMAKMGDVLNESLESGPNEESLSGLQTYMADIAWFSYLSSAFSLILAVLLTVAGIKLLKTRANALAWSNGYAWLSIATKLVSLVITFTIVLPASQNINPSAGELEQSISRFSTIISSLLSFVYPVLTLTLLNRAPVKAFLSTRGT